MRRKVIKPAKLKGAPHRGRRGGLTAEAPRRRKGDATEKWRRRWLGFYKLLACIAACAVALPYFEILVSVGAGPYATAYTWLSAALLFAVGYGIHKGLRTLLDKGDEEEFSFSFETKWQFSSPLVMVISLLLSGGIAVLFSFASGQMLEKLLYPDYNAEVGFPLLVVACTVATVMGALLVPFQFHQLCSLRTLIECLFAFGLPFGIATWGGNGVNGLFAACVLVYALCLFVLMNQEYVIKPAYTSKTCYATRELRLTGIGRALGLWLTTLLATLGILGLWALLVIPLRFLLIPDTLVVLDFPIKGMPDVNLALFFGGILLVAALSLWCILRFVKPHGLKYWERIIGDFFRRLWGFLCRLRFRKRDRLKEMEFKEILGERPKKQHYVDTVLEAKSETLQMPQTYRAFLRQLKALPNVNEQYRFAYEVLITELYDAHIGIAKHQTPMEMAAVILQKTNISNMDALTDTFESVTYAKNKSASPQDVAQVCCILQRRLKA